ncbi:Xanthoxin dehydrogenase [Capsicum chinense]|nr:Xanthoxin dehydrogenase [Capsicum chinense]
MYIVFLVSQGISIVSSRETNPSFHDQRIKRLLGRVALVTGGASGIGESTVRLFHKHGAKVCIVDIQDELGQRVCESLGDEQNACFIHCDVTSEADVSHAVDFAVQKFGTLDIMVNNAGVTGPPCSNILDYELSVFDNVLDVNVKGIFLGMKHAARIMIPRKSGSIVSLGSIAGSVGGLGNHAYTASKFAVVGLTQNVAAEMGKHGIRVNCVSPYAVATGLGLAHVPPDQRKDDAIADFHSYFGKFANLQGVDLVARDVANAVLFLASDEARYISGHDLKVDGGLSSVNHSLGVFR